MELSQLFYVWIPSALVLIYYILQTRSKSSSSGRLPPGPKPLPVIGNLHLMGDLPHRSLAGLAKTYGPLMSLKLGQVTTVVVTSPDMAREVLQKHDIAFSSRSIPDAARALGQHMLSMVWLPVGDQFRNLRKICNTQLFMSQKIVDNEGLRRKKVRELVSFVQERCAAGKVVNVGQAAFMTSLNLMSNTIFSVDLVDPKSNSTQNFRDLIWALLQEAGRPNISDFFPVLAPLDLQGRKRRLTNYASKMNESFDALIDRRLQDKAKGVAQTNDFLDSLLEFLIDDNTGKPHRAAINTLLTDLFIAGNDTSSNTVEWAMAQLLRNPTTMTKARAELLETIDAEKEVEESDIQRLPYLQAIVKETLRLHAPTPFLLPRRTEAIVELGDYTIPKHTRILVNAWAIGRDDHVWADADTFNPERFMTGDIGYTGQNFELIPFGAGRRICPGIPLAFRMVHLILASLLHSFDWKLPEGMKPSDIDMSEKVGLTVARVVPLQVIPC